MTTEAAQALVQKFATAVADWQYATDRGGKTTKAQIKVEQLAGNLLKELTGQKATADEITACLRRVGMI